MSDSDIGEPHDQQADRSCPEKQFALREAIRRATALQNVLSKAHLESNVERKLSLSILALHEADEIAVVLARVAVVLRGRVNAEIG